MEIQREDKEGDQWGVQGDIYLLEFQKINGWNQRDKSRKSRDESAKLRDKSRDSRNKSAKLRDERAGRSTNAETWGSREIHWAFISET